MKKSDLKTGMLVQYKNGKVRMVINDTLIGSDNYMQEIKSYNDDLTMNNHHRLCIKKVSEVLEAMQSAPKHWTEKTLNENLLWERSKPMPELKTGMIVEYNNGEVGLVINKNILITDAYMSIVGWEHLKSSNSNYEIIKVSKVMHSYHLLPQNAHNVLNDPDNIIWSK